MKARRTNTHRPAGASREGQEQATYRVLNRDGMRTEARLKDRLRAHRHDAAYGVVAVSA
jgi:hypothetical protein